MEYTLLPSSSGNKIISISESSRKNILETSYQIHSILSEDQSMPFGDSRLDWAVCFLIISKLGKLEMNYLLLILVHRKRIGISLSPALWSLQHLTRNGLCGCVSFSTSYLPTLNHTNLYTISENQDSSKFTQFIQDIHKEKALNEQIGPALT